MCYKIVPYSESEFPILNGTAAQNKIKILPHSLWF